MRHLIPVIALALAACATESAGPPLTKRPVESQPLTEPESRPAPPTPADTATGARIQALLAQAREGQTAFAAQLPRAQAAASKAGAQGSESWIGAQQQLSALEAARSPTSRALGELDTLIAAQVQAGTDAGLAELQTAQAEAMALADAQQREVDALRERISG